MFYKLKLMLKRTLIYDMVLRYREFNEFVKWKKEGCKMPMPEHLKREVILEYKSQCGNLNIFIETGTYLGFTVRSMKRKFAAVYSIELDKYLFQEAGKCFLYDRNVFLYHGDSESVLPLITGKINEPALFWLDAHFSGGITAKGNKYTPIESELATILHHPVDGHVILIDDARCFTGKQDYPTIDELTRIVKKIKPHYSVTVKDDIIRITK